MVFVLSDICNLTLVGHKKMIQTISYEGSDTTDLYWHLQNRLVKECGKYNLPHNPYHQKWLRTTQFYMFNKNLLDEKRGAGFWAWKPYIMKDALAKVAQYDIVCYMDASTTLRVDPTAIIESVEDVLVCDSSWRNYNWIKQDAFHFMHCDSDLYRNATQVWAGSVIVRNTEVGNDFVDDWLKYCCDRRIISDDKSVSGLEVPEFRDHRHDINFVSYKIY
jgi:hypothetical protein